jgi:hypothetical protein
MESKYLYKKEPAEEEGRERAHQHLDLSHVFESGGIFYALPIGSLVQRMRGG